MVAKMPDMCDTRACYAFGIGRNDCVCYTHGRIVLLYAQGLLSLARIAKVRGALGRAFSNGGCGGLQKSQCDGLRVSQYMLLACCLETVPDMHNT